MYYGILAFHVMSFISWMAALFYLPRLFVYHMEHYTKAQFVEVVKIQEHKLYYYIARPAMVATLFSGIAMISLNSALLEMGWFHLKLFAAVMMIGFHYMMGYYLKELKADSCSKSGRWFRMINEVPTLLMIIIVVMVVVKPF